MQRSLLHFFGKATTAQSSPSSVKSAPQPYTPEKPKTKLPPPQTQPRNTASASLSHGTDPIALPIKPAEIDDDEDENLRQRQQRLRKRRLLDDDDDAGIPVTPDLSDQTAVSTENAEKMSTTPKAQDVISSPLADFASFRSPASRARPTMTPQSAKSNSSAATPTKSKKASKASPAKRNKHNKDNDDDDDAYQPEENAESDDDDDEEGEDENLLEAEDKMDVDDEPKTPSRPAPSRNGSAKHTPSPLKRTPSSTERQAKFAKKNEERYKWLENIRDAQGRPKEHPEYDPSTLYIPPSAYEDLSPFEKQFWDVKRKYFDVVIFFKKGKFYELYENDAYIGHKELDLKMTDRVNMNMAGVPEGSFDLWAAKLIAKGYKVGRVDQTESKLQQLAGGKKIITRELKQILTAGTLVDETLIGDFNSAHLMAIREEVGTHEFGICFVDSSTGHFSVAHIKDDEQHSQFETLIVQIKPKEIVYGKGLLSPLSLNIIKRHVAAPIFNVLKEGTEFWDADTTKERLDAEGYFQDEWPDVFTSVMEQPIVMSAVGGCVYYLQELKLDKELLTMKNFEWYDTLQHGRTMILDGATLTNLEILQNSDGGADGSLYKLLNRCQTPFGKRLLRQWLCHPLRGIADINDRLDAVDDLRNHADMTVALAACLTRLPDLERMISRIHAGTMNLENFLSVLDGFQRATNALVRAQSQLATMKSKRLKAICTVGAVLPDLEPLLQWFTDAFDQQQAKKEGVIVPTKGTVEDYDLVMNRIRSYEQKLQEHLEEQREHFGSSDINYRHLNKEHYQIEVPLRYLKKRDAPSSYSIMSQTKDCKRYWTPLIRETWAKLERAQDERRDILADVLRRMLKKFDESYTIFMRFVQCVAELDCLLCLQKISVTGGEMCRPIFVDGEQPVLILQDSRHPTMEALFGNFVPNDIVLGGPKPSTMLLTGPNMGGKSTLLRQTCVAVIMAQLGCYVPAKSCKLSPVDRIFTRVGASDRILAGQSTFMVELSETSAILRNATKNSLVILDELGRGTSTYDGYAIAYAVIEHITRTIGCRALFSTHYHSLCTELSHIPSIGLYHMACLVDDEKREVTFLYKLQDGDCPKSYGMHVANMAGVPEVVVKRAETVAKDFELKSPFASKGADNSTEVAKSETLPLSLAELSMFKELASTVKGTEDSKAAILAMSKILALWAKAQSFRDVTA